MSEFNKTTDDLFNEQHTVNEIKSITNEPKPEVQPKPAQAPVSKPKIEFNILTIILVIVVVILIIVVILLIVKKPKVNNDLLVKTQEMYQETKKKNKELSDIVSDLEKKNKMLIESNEATVKTNGELKEQLSGIQIQYASTKDQLDEYKTREAQALEVSSTKSKTYAERKKELYDKINPPKEPVVEEHEEEPTGVIKLDTSNIAAQQQTITKQMTEQIKQAEQPQLSNELESVMSAIDA